MAIPPRILTLVAQRRRFLTIALVAMAMTVLAGLVVVASRPVLASSPVHGKVIAISDGDTLTVLVEEQPLKVRLWGIDTPEKAQAYGTQAKIALSDLTFGKQVTVDVRDIDRYGRSVGWVTVAGRPVNLTLVQLGMAWWYERFAPDAKELRTAEAKARAAKLGLWADLAPQPPWEFRKQRKR